jgi:hypothetical protein
MIVNFIKESSNLTKNYILNSLYFILKGISLFLIDTLTGGTINRDYSREKIEYAYKKFTHLHPKVGGIPTLSIERLKKNVKQLIFVILGKKLYNEIYNIQIDSLSKENKVWITEFMRLNSFFITTHKKDEEIVNYIIEFVHRFILYCKLKSDNNNINGTKNNIENLFFENLRNKNFIQQFKIYQIRIPTSIKELVSDKFYIEPPEKFVKGCKYNLNRGALKTRVIGRKLNEYYNTDIYDKNKNTTFYKNAKVLAHWFNRLKKDEVEILKQKFPNMNKPLLVLNRNKFLREERLAILKNLSGPYKIDIISSRKYKKNIILFGEKHDFRIPCRNGPDIYSSKDPNSMRLYIENMLINTGVFVDFFLESGTCKYYDDVMTCWKTSIHFLRKSFNKCFYDKQDKQCIYNDTSRIHYIDTRSSFLSGLNLFSFSHGFFFLYQGLTETIFYDYRKYITDFFHYDPAKTFEDHCEQIAHKITKELFDHVLIEKEMKNLNGILELDIIKQLKLYTKLIINQYYRKDYFKIKKIINELNNISLDSDELSDTSKKISKLKNKVKNDLHYILINLYAHQIDIVLILRLFKKFSREVIKCQPENINNVIVYAGSMHTDFQKGFLTEVLGFRKDFSRTSSIDCIQFPSIIDEPLTKFFDNF